MKKNELMTSVLALFRQNLTREQIARELKVTVEILDAEMELFFSTPLTESTEESNLPFDFEEKFELLMSPIVRFFKGKYIRVDTSEYLTTRIVNSFKAGEIVFLWEILIIDDIFSCRFRNFSSGSLRHLKQFLSSKGLPTYKIKFTSSQLIRLKAATTEKK